MYLLEVMHTHAGYETVDENRLFPFSEPNLGLIHVPFSKTATRFCDSTSMSTADPVERGLLNSTEILIVSTLSNVVAASWSKTLESPGKTPAPVTSQNVLFFCVLINFSDAFFTFI